ncbi:MAG TPA: sigma 54-interacting transcriptional regulator [Polyangiaceae bacterium]|nr:sigma 54-interacting transcriptional regulator [Polyangiaceae bacterium]
MTLRRPWAWQARWRRSGNRSSVPGVPAEGPWFSSTHPNAPVSVGAGPALELVVVHPPEVSGLCFPLGSGLVFGRAAEPKMAAIPHATISRQHAAVRLGMGGVLLLEDLQSRNGTKVNGARPELPVPLQPQTLVRLGDVHAVVDTRAQRRFNQDPVLPGSSPRLDHVRSKLEEAASGSAAVLIIGETGTGKERLAREVHRLSGRAGQYITLNCAELSPQLIESQLFGHERGAFTGASAAKPGLFAAAHRGTLFLDEIGELSLELQPKLLRVLQEGEVRRVGSVETERIDTRVVAATNRDLPALVEQGAFRRDLYARLSFHELRLPPLRERRQDLLGWLALLSENYGQTRGAAVALSFGADAVERILLHTWPDNLRGLDRLVHRLASHTGNVGVTALLEALPELRARSEAPSVAETMPPRGSASSSPPQASPSPAPSREEFLAAYEACGRSIRGTAKHFGKDRRQIYRWLERFGVPRDDAQD